MNDIILKYKLVDYDNLDQLKVIITNSLIAKTITKYTPNIYDESDVKADWNGVCYVVKRTVNIIIQIKNDKVSFNTLIHEIYHGVQDYIDYNFGRHETITELEENAARLMGDISSFVFNELIELGIKFEYDKNNHVRIKKLLK